MVTSTLGWFPTPYLPLPVDLRDLISGARRQPLDDVPSGLLPGDPRVRLHFFPGVRARADILRGEEIQALGILHALGASGEMRAGTLVLPGTHSKWIRFEDGRLVDFLTLPTGDLHAALHRESLLARTLPERPVAVDGALLEVFDSGVREARRYGVLSSLFKVRALGVLDDPHLDPPECSAFLSGILVGSEIMEGLTRREIDSNQLERDQLEPIRLGGVETLQRLYRRAFSILLDDDHERQRRVRVREIDASVTGAATLLGILELRKLGIEAGG